MNSSAVALGLWRVLGTLCLLAASSCGNKQLHKTKAPRLTDGDYYIRLDFTGGDRPAERGSAFVRMATDGESVAIQSVDDDMFLIKGRFVGNRFVGSLAAPDGAIDFEGKVIAESRIEGTFSTREHVGGKPVEGKGRWILEPAADRSLSFDGHAGELEGIEYLKNDNELDDSCDNSHCPMNIPRDMTKRIEYLLRELDLATESASSPLGLAVNPASIELVATGPAAIPNAMLAFGEACRSGNEERARLLACVLGRLRAKEAFGLLAVAALTYDSWVDASCAFALGRLGHKGAAPVLVELLYANPSTDLAAGASLARITGVSYPRPVYHPGKTEPVAVWEDVDKWKSWGRKQHFDLKSLVSDEVHRALLAHQVKRRGRDEETVPEGP